MEMKLIGNLKKQVEATTTKDEAREVILKAGMELTNDELDMVAGGQGEPEYCSCSAPDFGENDGQVYCSNCNKLRPGAERKPPINRILTLFD